MSDTPSKASILGALSKALDLVEGQPKGHALRTAKLALRIAEEMGLTQEQKDDLYFAAVLKDSGCSNNAVRIQKMFGGDEFLAKNKVKLIDWTNSVESLKFAIAQTEAGNSIGAKLRRLASNLGHPTKVMDEVTEARCTRGAFIANMLGLDPLVAEAIQSLDEHWDGHGSPYKLKGESICIHARILCFAQTFEVFFQSLGIEAAYEMAADRSGRWFDPVIVSACNALRNEHEFWATFDDVQPLEAWAEEHFHAAMPTDLDAICRAFAMIIDAKSSFTSQHSSRVASYACKIGAHLGLAPDQIKLLERSGMLHDIGKLGISTGILEKPGRLEPSEFEQIKLHPKFSDQVLRPIPTFGPIAEIASAHHERLDGKGYWRGLSGSEISIEARIMTVADVLDALTAKRPYRDAMPYEKVREIMFQDSGSAFDPDCLCAMDEIWGENTEFFAEAA